MARSWLDVILTPVMLQVVEIAGLSVCAIVAAAGYRRLGLALLIAGVAAGIVGAAVGFIVLIACTVPMGRAEWGGIAALVVGILAGIATTGVSFVGGIIWLVAKHKRYVQRDPQWWPLYRRCGGTSPFRVDGVVALSGDAHDRVAGTASRCRHLRDGKPASSGAGAGAPRTRGRP